jgi:hypothetical protein
MAGELRVGVYPVVSGSAIMADYWVENYTDMSFPPGTLQLTLYIDGVPVDSCSNGITINPTGFTVCGYNSSWYGVTFPPGTHTVYAEVRTPYGHYAKTDVVTVTVGAPPPPPPPPSPTPTVTATKVEFVDKDLGPVYSIDMSRTVYLQSWMDFFRLNVYYTASGTWGGKAQISVNDQVVNTVDIAGESGSGMVSIIGTAIYSGTIGDFIKKYAKDNKLEICVDIVNVYAR